MLSINRWIPAFAGQMIKSYTVVHESELATDDIGQNERVGIFETETSRDLIELDCVLDPLLDDLVDVARQQHVVGRISLVTAH